MKRYSFFVDFDDTLIPTKHLVAQYLGNKYGVKLNSEDIANNNAFDGTLKNFGVNVGYNEVYLDFGKNFFPSFGIENFILYPGEKEAIEKLFEIYNIYIVTSRQECEKEYLKDILRKNNILDCFQKNIHCVWRMEKGGFKEDTKASFMKRQEGINIGFLDDSLFEIKKALKDSIYPILFDPFCAHKGEGLGYGVCSTWRQVEKIFS